MPTIIELIATIKKEILQPEVTPSKKEILQTEVAPSPNLFSDDDKKIESLSHDVLDAIVRYLHESFKKYRHIQITGVEHENEIKTMINDNLILPVVKAYGRQFLSDRNRIPQKFDDNMTLEEAILQRSVNGSHLISEIKSKLGEFSYVNLKKAYRKENPSKTDALKNTKKTFLDSTQGVDVKSTILFAFAYIDKHPQNFLDAMKGFISHRTKDALKAKVGSRVVAILELSAKEKIALDKNLNSELHQAKYDFLKKVAEHINEQEHIAEAVRRALQSYQGEDIPDLILALQGATSRVKKIVESIIGKDGLADILSDQSSEMHATWQPKI